MRILLVEDNDADAVLFAIHVGTAATIERVRDLQSALEALTANTPDLLVSDYWHVEEVKTLINEVRESWPQVRIVIYSGCPPVEPPAGAVTFEKSSYLDVQRERVRAMLAG